MLNNIYDTSEQRLNDSYDNVVFYRNKYEQAERDYQERSLWSRLTRRKRDLNSFLNLSFYSKMLNIAFSEHAKLLFRRGDLVMSGYPEIGSEIIIDAGS